MSPQACVKETMRLYPLAFPVRISSKPATIRGLRVPAGTVVHAATYAMHRDARAWPHPDEFRPQRFVEGLSAAAEALYHPFGVGPRSCVGCGAPCLTAPCLMLRPRRVLWSPPPCTHGRACDCVLTALDVQHMAHGR